MATLTQVSPITFDRHVHLIARIGYAARAGVYALMGTFALLLSLGFKKGQLTDSKGSLRQLIEQPFGKLFLAVLGVGLIAYAVWRLLQAVLDYEHKANSAFWTISSWRCSIRNFRFRDRADHDRHKRKIYDASLFACR